MKKTTLLNAPISALIARLGHCDEICIADAGLPIPNSVLRIDLALIRSIPSFLDTLDAVVAEMTVEHAVIASELTIANVPLYDDISSRLLALQTQQDNQIELASVSHDDFKLRTHSCKAVIRTGECSAYANIILKAGVCF